MFIVMIYLVKSVYYFLQFQQKKQGILMKENKLKTLKVNCQIIKDDSFSLVLGKNLCLHMEVFSGVVIGKEDVKKMIEFLTDYLLEEDKK